jgi:hypothetical protein
LSPHGTGYQDYQRGVFAYSTVDEYGKTVDVKTTVELPDALVREAKEYAARHGIAMGEVMERGVRLVLRESLSPENGFRLRTVTTKGEGLVSDADWPTTRSLIYEGHGG